MNAESKPVRVTRVAMNEGGDVTRAIRDGATTAGLMAEHVFDHRAGHLEGRRTDDEVTPVRSVRTAIEDLAAAVLVRRSPQASS